MIEDNMKAAARRYVKAIKETDCYVKYAAQLQTIQRYPEIYEQVNEYREKNYQIQNLTSQEKLFDAVDELEKEYAEFRKNPMVDDFLRAELAFCRMMQEVNIFTMQELDFE